jgi:UDP:flavonoid glycosyltransferase YjiC (YdhE family)
LIYYAEADRTLIQRYAAPYLRIVDHPVDMDRVAEECDLALLYGSHDTTAAMLQAGKPILQLPQHVEQFLVASRTEQLGAGICLHSTEESAIANALNELLSIGAYRVAAESFANRYQGLDASIVLQQVVNRVERLAIG